MKTKFKINLIQKLKAQLIIFYYENIFSIFSNRLEIERLQIRSSIKNIDDCKHTKRISEVSKFLHSIKKKSKSINSLSDYLESLPKTDISKELETRQVDAQEAAKKIEQLRKDLEDEAARRKEEEEIEAEYLANKFSKFTHPIPEPIQKASKPKAKKQNEKSNSEPKKKSVTKDKPTPTRKKAKKD